MTEEDNTIAKLRKDGETFEILVDCREAIKVKEGKGSIEDALLVHEIFKDAKKGEKHGELSKYFGTENVYEIAEKIIKEGEILLTQSYRNELTEQKKKQVIAEIARRAIDPKTKMPIPPKRIELGIEQLGIKIDYQKSVKDQAKEIIERLRSIMPITIQELVLRIIVRPQYIGKAYGIIKRHGELLGQNYLNDGSTEFAVKVLGGAKNELISELNSLTHGNIIIKED